MDRRNEDQGNEDEKLVGFNFKNLHNQEEVLVVRNEPLVTDRSPKNKEMNTIRFVRTGKPVYVKSTKRTGREKKCIIL